MSSQIPDTNISDLVNTVMLHIKQECWNNITNSALVFIGAMECIPNNHSKLEIMASLGAAFKKYDVHNGNTEFIDRLIKIFIGSVSSPNIANLGYIIIGYNGQSIKPDETVCDILLRVGAFLTAVPIENPIKGPIPATKKSVCAM
jgi:hypothetical protein